MNDKVIITDEEYITGLLNTIEAELRRMLAMGPHEDYIQGGQAVILEVVVLK